MSGSAGTNSLPSARRPWYSRACAQAVRHFPQNLNVAATISLAGLGLERTAVGVIADPETTRNRHEVFLRGDLGEATLRLVNVSSSEPPGRVRRRVSPSLPCSIPSVGLAKSACDIDLRDYSPQKTRFPIEFVRPKEYPVTNCFVAGRLTETLAAPEMTIPGFQGN